MKNSTEISFKKPNLNYKPLPQKPNPKVLDEDVYVDLVGEIIERDFYPNLKKMKVQNEYLDAVAVSDENKKKSLEIELLRIMTGKEVGRKPQATPSQSVQATPLKTDQQPIELLQNPQKQKINVKNFTLDKFQSAYTSEDNASFDFVIKKHNQEINRKYDWVFDGDQNNLKLQGPKIDSDGNQGPMNKIDMGERDETHGNIELWRFKVFAIYFLE